MNILIKLMSIVSLVIAPTLANMYSEKISAERVQKIQTLTNTLSAKTHGAEKEGGLEIKMINKDGTISNNIVKSEKMTQDADILVTALVNDKLIDPRDFKLEIRQMKLIVNDQPQPETVNARYRELMLPFKDTDLNINIYRK
jgi:K(+)-stimulated pyrophosphate-energized sodium pump